MNAKVNARETKTSAAIKPALSLAPWAGPTGKAGDAYVGVETLPPGANATDARVIARPAEPARS